MKKGLSVLLIVAALFGFYGGASSLTDVLACKDYWEKEGEKSTADMNKLEDGLNQLGENEQAYLDGVQKLAENEPKLEEGKQTLAEKEAEFAAAPAKLRKGEADLAAGKSAYADGQKTYDAGMKQYKESKATLEDMEGKLNTLKAGFKQWSDTYADQLTTAMKNKSTKPYLLTYKDNGVEKAPSVDDEKASELLKDILTNGATELGARGYLDQLAKYKTADPQTRVGILGALAKSLKTQAETGIGPDGQELTPDQRQKCGVDAAVFADLGTDGKFYLTQIGLVSNRKAMKEQIMPLLKKMAGDESVAKKLKPYGGVDGIDKMLSDNGGVFIGTVTKLIEVADDAVAAGKQALAAAKKQLDAGAKKLAAARKQIKAGEAKLAKGYADYEAAPAKLAAGRQQLADGLKQLEEGKKQLAQYEDGEQQVRDGLATLMSTEPNGGLESILDRRGGDDEFDDANGHLDVQEGLDAVKVGRGYQADSGELITKEITNRAVGTAAGLGAAVLACLAALLSLIKKYKGAAVTAVLAAIAGVAGAVVGNGAGSEFSNIAGSTVGSLPWIAAGVVAAVACVFAIVNFTAKAE